MKDKRVGVRLTNGLYEKVHEYATTYGIYGRKTTVSEVVRQAVIEYIERHHPKYRVKLHVAVPRINLEELTEEQLMMVLQAAATLKTLCGAEANDLLDEVQNRLVFNRFKGGEQ